MQDGFESVFASSRPEGFQKRPKVLGIVRGNRHHYRVVTSSRFKFSATFLAFSLALSGAEDEFPVFELNPIVVRAAGLEADLQAVPAAVSVIDRATIQDGSAQLAIDQALQTVPGVFVLNPTNFAQDARIAIRGFGARSDFGIRGVRLVVDGIPATLPDGQAGVDGIDLGSAGRMEVIRGPAAAIYGPASGGVIRIETEAPPSRPFSELRLTTGEYGLSKSQLKSGWSEGPWSMLLSTTYLDTTGYRENNRTMNRSLNAKLGYRFEDGAELNAVINWIDYPRQDDPGGLTAAEAAADPRQARARNLQFDGGESVRQQKLGLAYDKPLANESEWRAHAFAVQRDFANKLPFTDGGQVRFDRNFFGGGSSLTYGGKPLRLMAGLELGHQFDARKRYDNLDGAQGPLALDQDESVLNLGSFLTGELSLPADLRLSAALRYDEVHFDVDDAFLADGDDSGAMTFRETSPMLGLQWAPVPDISFYANLATSFETPTTTEFANPNGGGFNPGLSAQTALNHELGVKGQLPELPARPGFELALFHIEVEDALVPFGSPERGFFRNAGSSRRAGLEAAVDLKPTERWFARLSYTYSDFRYATFKTPGGDFSGNRLPGIPEHFANLNLSYADPSGISLVWNTRIVGALEADDANTTRVSGYSVTDLRLRWEGDFDAWTLEGFAGLNNLFDKAYPANIRINAFGGRFFEPAPERNLYGGVRLRYWIGAD